MSELDFKQRLSEIGSELESATGKHVVRRQRRRRVATAAACLLVALVVATAAITQLDSGGGEPAVAQVLDRAALAGPPKLKTGEYLFTRTLVVTVANTGTGPNELRITTRQSTDLWAGADGSGLQVERQPEREIKQVNPPPPPPPGSSDGASASPAPSITEFPAKRAAPKISRFKRGTIGTGELGPVDVAFRDRLLATYGLDAGQLVRLSYNQQAFDKALRAGAAKVTKQLGGSAADAAAVDREAFAMVASLLGQWGEPMPKTLRNALFSFTSGLDGATVDKAATDGVGKKVVKLSLGDAAIMFDPVSYRLIGTETRDGRETTQIQTVRSKIVERLPKNPL